MASADFELRELGVAGPSLPRGALSRLGSTRWGGRPWWRGLCVRTRDGFAVVTDGRFVRVMEATQGALRFVLRVVPGIRKALLASDGRTLVLSLQQERPWRLLLWRPGHGPPQVVMEAPEPVYLAASDGIARRVVALDEQGRLSLMDLPGRKLVGVIPVPSGFSYGPVALAPDGQRVGLVISDLCKPWDEAWQPPRLELHEPGVRGRLAELPGGPSPELLWFAQDSTRLEGGSEGKGAFSLDAGLVASGRAPEPFWLDCEQEIGRLPEAERPVGELKTLGPGLGLGPLPVPGGRAGLPPRFVPEVASPCGRYLAGFLPSPGNPQEVCIVGPSASGGRVVRFPIEPIGEGFPSLLPAHGALLLRIMGRVLELRSWDEGTRLARLERAQDGAGAGAVSPDAALVAMPAREGGVLLWEPPDRVATILESLGQVSAVALPTGGRFLWLADAEGRVRIYDRRTGALGRAEQAHFGPIVESLASSDGSRVATRSTDGTALVFDVTELVERTLD